jgi:hypothetical protein
MNLLEADGYHTTRAAGSLGTWDVIGIGDEDVILLQVKTNRWPRAVEMQMLRQFPTPPNVRKLVHCWRRGRAEPDIREL